MDRLLASRTAFQRPRRQPSAEDAIAVSGKRALRVQGVANVGDVSETHGAIVSPASLPSHGSGGLNSMCLPGGHRVGDRREVAVVKDRC